MAIGANRIVAVQFGALSQRQILDGLAKANGNALWIAEFDPKNFASEPKSNAAGALKDKAAESTRRWQFVPLVIR